MGGGPDRHAIIAAGAAQMKSEIELMADKPNLVDALQVMMQQFVPIRSVEWHLGHH